jgi:hypothetical protein
VSAPELAQVTAEHRAAGESGTGEHAVLARPSGEHAAVTGRGGKPARSVGLRLFAVVALGVEPRPLLAAHPALLEGTELVAFRDIAAVVSPAAYAAEPLGLPDLEDYRAVVSALFTARATLPAPPGTVFRAREALAEWLELHYFTLVEALNFVDGRVTARVTVTPDRPGTGGRPAPLRLAAPTGQTREEEIAALAAPDAAADGLVARAAEAFAALRREAASFLVLRADAGREDEAAHASFLVDRDRWAVFEQAVSREARQRPGLRLACSGPWPPYDFVRMQFTS